jgi:hypothetical protein
MQVAVTDFWDVVMFMIELTPERTELLINRDWIKVRNCFPTVSRMVEMPCISGINVKKLIEELE